MKIARTATVSLDGQYRYRLYRGWGTGSGTVTWVMLNPSVADADIDDHTVRCCMRYSQAWGYAGLLIVNRYALRATKPDELDAHPDPVGPANEEALHYAISHADSGPLVLAWGSRRPRAPSPDPVRIAHQYGVEPTCLAFTRAGAPRHPSRLQVGLTPIPYPARTAIP